MPIRNIRRQSSNPGAIAGTPGSAPIYVDSDDNTLKIIPAGSGTTEVEISRVTYAPVAGGSALTVTQAAHAGRTLLFDTATGTTFTLPAATGTGAKYRFVISVIATSNSHKIQVASASDIIQGMCLTCQDAGDTLVAFETTGTSDTITLNRTTTGSTQVGEWFVLEDIATGVWSVFGVNAATGTEATPFSAAV